MKSASFTPEFVEEMDEPEEYRVVKTKRFPVKPMEVDEAILQMNMLDHTFFVSAVRKADRSTLCINATTATTR